MSVLWASLGILIVAAVVVDIVVEVQRRPRCDVCGQRLVSPHHAEITTESSESYPEWAESAPDVFCASHCPGDCLEESCAR